MSRPPVTKRDVERELHDYPGPRGSPTISYVALAPTEDYSAKGPRDLQRQNKYTLAVDDGGKVSGGREDGGSQPI
jgi:hypothetical protein